MKNHLLSVLSRSLFYKHRIIPCVYESISVRHFSDKKDGSNPGDQESSNDKDTIRTDSTASGQPTRDLTTQESKVADPHKALKETTNRYSFNDAEAPSGYVDPAKTDEHYHIKRAMRILKLDFQKLWRNVQDPESRYQGNTLFPTHVDILIIGGGAIGSSIAYFIKEKVLDGCRVAVVDRDFTYARASTTLSVGGLRQQFSLRENIEMSLFGAEFLRNIKHHCHVIGEDEPDVNFTPNGYLFCASQDGAATLEKNHQLQKELGAKNVLLGPEQLKAKFPWLNTDDIALACLGLEKEGWFDPWLYLNAVKKKAISLGAEYVRGEVVDFLRRRNNQVHYEGYDDGEYHSVNECVVRDEKGELKTITFAICVIAAGAYSGQVARMLKIGDKNQEQGFLFVPLPVEPRKRYVYCFESPRGPGVNTPMVVDTTGTYFRREGLGNYYICGKSPTPEQEPPVDNLDVDYEYFNENVWPHLAHRVKAFEELKVSNAWAGYYDYNYFDENAIIGLHPSYHNIHFATGFSGHGIQQAPAIGRAVSELILDAEFKTIDLSRFLLERVARRQEAREVNIV
ncbi:hypothetical protein M8J75_011372 [Diaphorina citri]|nr:hypothetical protein M8J75_011372 [Diaphorina citri]KAI5744047.1 hypothetical protein M8J77_025157 [Diaphorina citri]